MDLKTLAEGQGLTPEEFMEIVDLLVETTRTDIEKMQAAVAAGDFEAAGDAAHSIKGAAGNMGFMELFAAAKAVEEQARQSARNQMTVEIETLIKQVEAIKTRLQQEQS